MGRKAMVIIMNRIRNSIIIASYVLLVGVFFFGGYALGSIREMANTPRATEEPLEVMNMTGQESSEYRLILEDGKLNLYSINGAIKEIMACEDISIGVYPPSDIIELEKGITFDNIEDAQLLFENFVS